MWKKLLIITPGDLDGQMIQVVRARKFSSWVEFLLPTKTVLKKILFSNFRSDPSWFLLHWSRSRSILD